MTSIMGENTYELKGIIKSYQGIVVYNALCKETNIFYNIAKAVKDPLNIPYINPFTNLLTFKCEFLHKCVDVFEDLSGYYAVFEIPNGKSLAETIQREGPLKDDKASSILTQVLCAVKCVHTNGFANIKINPTTIYLNPTGMITIADFQFTGSVQTNDRLKAIPDSLENSPPELIMHGCYVASHIDIWTIGVFAFTISTGKHPFVSNMPTYYQSENAVRAAILTPISVPSFVGGPATNFIQRTMEIDPQRRFSIEQCLTHVWFAKKNRGRRISSYGSSGSIRLEDNGIMRSNGLSVLGHKTSPTKFNSVNLSSMRSFSDYSSALQEYV